MFWKIFSQLCNERDIKPNNVAKLLGIASGTVSGWKLKGQTPQENNLIKIANYFGVSVAYLKGEEPDSDPIQLDDSRVGIMKKLNTLTPDQVKAAEQYIDFLASQTQNQ